jgi:hypothetical protein
MRYQSIGSMARSYMRARQYDFAAYVRGPHVAMSLSYSLRLAMSFLQTLRFAEFQLTCWDIRSDIDTQIQYSL